RNLLMRWRAAQREGERQQGHQTEHTDAEVRLAPAICRHEVLDKRRPDRASEIVAAGANRYRDTTTTGEPVRDVGQERSKTRRAANANEQPVNNGELPQAPGLTGENVAYAEEDCSAGNRKDNAVPVGEPPREDPARCKGQERDGVRQRRARASDAEFCFDRRQNDDDRPHADATDSADEHRCSEAHPGIGRLDLAGTGNNLAVTDAHGTRSQLPRSVDTPNKVGAQSKLARTDQP